MSEPGPLLTMSGVVKRFPGVTALDHVDFDLRRGEVHALMGENGAGKSTLIKVLTGVHPPDAGLVSLEGREIAPRSPDDAVRLGISTVYQEVNLAPNLSVAENVCLGREPKGRLGIDWRTLRSRAKAALERVGVTVDPRKPLAACSIAVQQMVAIARALDVSAKILVLDEPTSSLDAREVAQLFELVRRLRSEGLGILFVSHFIDQVYELSDRITILRNGALVGCRETAAFPKIELVSLMIGRDASTLERSAAPEAPPKSGESVISAAGLGRRGAVEGVELDLRGGEVLGLAGLLGSGRTETIRLLFGLDAPTSGTLRAGGRELRRFGPRAAIRLGFGFCSEDRKAQGLFPELTVRENILIVLQAKRGWLRRVPARRQREIAQRLVSELRLQPPDVERPIQTLSGGNQQKALLARWLAVQPRLLLLDEPTRGIDVGAKFEIMSLVDQLAREGTAFVFVSSELSELVRTCTRVRVLRDRKMVGVFERNEISEERIVAAIAEGTT